MMGRVFTAPAAAAAESDDIAPDPGTRQILLLGWTPQVCQAYPERRYRDDGAAAAEAGDDDETGCRILKMRRAPRKTGRRRSQRLLQRGRRSVELHPSAGDGDGAAAAGGGAGGSAGWCGDWRESRAVTGDCWRSRANSSGRGEGEGVR